jgi:DNA-binding NtrC family response regulator
MNGSVTAIDPARLLLVGNGLGDRLGTALAAEFVDAPVVVELDNGRSALELLKASPFDGVIADLDALADLADSTEERIGRLARVASGALLAVLTGDASISVAMAAMRAGAHDCSASDLGGDALVLRLGELARRHGKARICLRAGMEAPMEAAPAPGIPVMRDLVLPMWRQEQRIIEDAIQSFAGNIALAAAALELSPSTIYRKRQAWAEMGGKRA